MIECFWSEIVLQKATVQTTAQKRRGNYSLDKTIPKHKKNTRKIAKTTPQKTTGSDSIVENLRWHETQQQEDSAKTKPHPAT